MIDPYFIDGLKPFADEKVCSRERKELGRRQHLYVDIMHLELGVALGEWLKFAKIWQTFYHSRHEHDEHFPARRTQVFCR